MYLAMRKRPKGQHLHAASQGLGQLWQEHYVRRSREQKLPRLPLSVNGGFDHREDFRNMLHFIQRDRHVQSGNETVRIALGSRQNARIIEGEVLAGLSPPFPPPMQA